MAILNHGVFIAQIKGRVSDGVYATTPARSGGVAVVRKLPRHVKTYRSHSQHNFCPCAAWSTCDALWIAFSAAQQQVWRDALTRAGMSGYDLWMSECLTTTIAGQYAPDAPSASGGWSTNEATAGSTYPPPDECAQAPPPSNVCVYCPSPTPSPPASVTAVVSLTGPCAGLFNGSYTMLAEDCKHWVDPGPPKAELACVAGNYWYFFTGAVPMVVESYPEISYDGASLSGTGTMAGIYFCGGTSGTVVFS